jgi:hypothetical protein
MKKMVRGKSRKSRSPRDTTNSSVGERIGEFIPGLADRIILMTPAQLVTYIGSSHRKWDARIGPGGDLYEKYKD